MRGRGDSLTRRQFGTLGLVLFLLLTWGGLQIRTDYLVLSPGPIFDVAPMITVKDATPTPEGSLYLTTVYSDMDVSVAEWIQSRTTANLLLLPKGEVIPPSISEQEYAELVRELMDESKVISKIVALRHLGYDVEATGQGARVQKLLPGSTVAGILQEADVVVKAMDQQIQLSTDLVNLVRRQDPGSAIPLVVRRDGRELEILVTTRESDTEPGISVVGIMIRTQLFDHDLPVQIEIDSENIGGPSAGLMFALGIVDTLQEGEITSGHKVAGTGTLSLDGTVGPIGGVSQKVVGAERAGAEFFLSPLDNVAAAKGVASKIQIVPVGTLDDAVRFLKTLEPASMGQVSSGTTSGAAWAADEGGPSGHLGEP